MEKEKRSDIPFSLVFFMTALSGALNVYAIKVFGNTVTHHTGNLSNLAINLFENSYMFGRLLLIVLTFMLGSLGAGLIFDRRGEFYISCYGRALIASGIVLFIFNFLYGSIVTVYLISFISGLENGMKLYCQGIKVRFTHMTGYLTDLGVNLAVVDKDDEARARVRFYIQSILAFIFGGITVYLLMLSLTFSLAIIGLLTAFSGYRLIKMNKCTCFEK